MLNAAAAEFITLQAVYRRVKTPRALPPLLVIFATWLKKLLPEVNCQL